MRLNEGSVCPVCEEGKLKAARKKIEFVYKDNKSHVEGGVFECDLCGESFLDEKDEREIERMLTDQRRKIDGLLTSSEIRNIRRRFGFTQVEFAKILAVGEKNFARYESGRAVQGRTTDHLLRILMRLPEALEIITSGPSAWDAGKTKASDSAN